MMFVDRLLRRRDVEDDEPPQLAPRSWQDGQANVGLRRPDGWEPEALIVRRGVRAGRSPRTAPRVIQIRVETQ